MSSRTSTSKSRKAAERQRRAAHLAVERARAERRRRVRIAVASIVAVALVLTGLVVASVAGIGGGDDAPAASSSSAAAAVKAATNVPAASLNKVGAGTSQTPPTRVPDATPLTEDGKPKVLYVGAEYCPYCAAERWPLVVALSRFGTWKGLGGSESASDDVYPRTKTLTFHGATYSSDHLAFTGVETATNQKVNGTYEKLDELTGDDAENFATYARPPFISGPEGSIPFLNLGGDFVLGGSQYVPDVLVGQSRTDIASALKDPTNEAAQAINGSANVLTAALCELTDGSPHNVCMSTGVMRAAKKLDTGS